MKRIIILGRGGSGKSTLAKQLSKMLNIPHVELDKYFWKPGLIATPINEWKNVQSKLASQNKWVMDGDLGKYDALEVRLKEADTIILLDFPLLLCLKRSFRRSKERFDFWWWLISWRLLYKPKIIKSIKANAPKANFLIFRNPKNVEEFISKIKLKE